MDTHAHLSQEEVDIIKAEIAAREARMKQTRENMAKPVASLSPDEALVIQRMLEQAEQDKELAAVPETSHPDDAKIINNLLARMKAQEISDLQAEIEKVIAAIGPATEEQNKKYQEFNQGTERFSAITPDVKKQLEQMNAEQAQEYIKNLTDGQEKIKASLSKLPENEPRKNEISTAFERLLNILQTKIDFVKGIQEIKKADLTELHQLVEGWPGDVGHPLAGADEEIEALLANVPSGKPDEGGAAAENI